VTWPLFGALLLIAGLSGCTVIAPIAELAGRQVVARRQLAPSAATAPIDLADASSNRLLVTGVDGNLFTVKPDGSGRFALTTDAGVGRLYSQPTWSATGARIGWTKLERRDGELISSLVTSKANGAEPTSLETLFPPFYLYWSPDDRQLAYLSNWLDDSGPTIALQSADIAGGGTGSKILGTGQPFYFSWAPDGNRLIAHVGSQQVVLIDTTVDTTKREPLLVEEGSANFAAPQWLSTTDQFLYVTADERTAQLLLTDAAGAAPERLTYLTRQDQISFGLNATGSHIAYIETSAELGFNAFGPLFLYDRNTGSFAQVSTAPTVAFFWSPDGSALFFLTVEAETDQIWLRVNVWEEAGVRQYARFIPSIAYLRDYLPFADQYMQSLRFWAPDSRALVYTGQAEDGTAGVWVQEITGEAAPQLVAAGTFATWSPR